MNDPIQDGMAEATRLTREGRLAEATALIQRTLGRGGLPGTRDTPGGGEETSRQDRRALDRGAPPEPPPETEASGLRQPPSPPRGFRGTPRPEGSVPGSMSGFVTGITSRLGAGGPAPAVVPEGARFVERSYAGPAGSRAYKLYVPSGYAGQEVPLVVMLHGCTQDPDDFAAGTRMNALAEEHTLLVAYPAQSRGANTQGCWSWFEGSEQQRGRGEPSIIAGITREVSEEYRVAGGQVYIAGMSAGGAMAAILASTYPDLYAAAGIHSGLAPGAARDLSSAFTAMRGGGPPTTDGSPRTGEAVPVIVFHGDRDTTVHPRNAGCLISAYQGEHAPPVRVRRGQVPDGHAYTRATHHDAGGRAVAEQWTVHGLGHAWSGGGSSGSYTDPKGPDASAEMLRFFRQHPRP